jgi:SAM-dependent methyltransferase
VTDGRDLRGALLAGPKHAAEQVLWGRVRLQRALESRAGRSRPFPALVPPTAVLRSRAEWEEAVSEARRLRLPVHHSRPKMWDTLGALGAVLASGADGRARVLDAGSARYSTLLPSLYLYGLSELVGLNLEFRREVRHGPVRYRYGDITATGLPDGSFDAVACLSVIEHGVPVSAFLRESARLLRTGGVLVVSTDYDQDPVDTSSHSAYGQPVHVFSPVEMQALVAEAERQGLRLHGDLHLDHEERPVHWKRMNLDFTFILLTFDRVQ